MKYEQKHLEWFVSGAVEEYLVGKKDAFFSYRRGTINLVEAYLAGNRTLDGTCSDFECHIALEAEKLFKPKEVVSAPSSVFETRGYMKRLFSSKEEAQRYSEDYGDVSTVEYPLLSSYEEAVAYDNNVRREAARRKLTQEELELLGLA